MADGTDSKLWLVRDLVEAAREIVLRDKDAACDMRRWNEAKNRLLQAATVVEAAFFPEEGAEAMKVYALCCPQRHPMTPTGWRCGECGARVSDEPLPRPDEEVVWAAVFAATLYDEAKLSALVTDRDVEKAVAFADVAVAKLRARKA